MTRIAYARTAPATLLAVILAVAVASGCSSSDDSASEATSSSSAPAASAPAGASTPAPAAAVTVDVADMKFSPAKVTVNVGDTVTWKFDDKGIPHTVSGLRDVGMVLDSPIQKDGSYSHTFDKAGTYDYICSIHPEMKGTVTVR